MNDMTPDSGQPISHDSDLPYEVMAQRATEATRLLKALSQETRLMLLCQLMQGEFSVGELNARVPVSQSALSQHLAVLRKDHLVKTRQESQTVYYQLADDRAQRILAVLCDILGRDDNGAP